MFKRYSAVIALTLLLISHFDIVAGTPSLFTRRAPRNGDFGLTLRPSLVFTTGNSTFVGTASLAYGLVSGITLNGHVGTGQSPYDPSFGGDLRITLASSRGGVGFDIYGGGHGGGFGAGFDAGAVLSGNLKGLGIYGGLDLDYISRSGSSTTPMNIIAGIDFLVGRSTTFFINGDFALNKEAVSGISGGLYFSF